MSHIRIFTAAAFLFFPIVTIAGSYEEGLQALRRLAFTEAHCCFDQAYMEQNDARATGNLAVMKLTGKGCLRSSERAKGLMVLAAHNGDRIAQKNLATMYSHGLCVKQDDEKAQLWTNESQWEKDEKPALRNGARSIKYKVASNKEVRFWLKTTDDMKHIIPNYKLGITPYTTAAAKRQSLPPIWAPPRLKGTEYNPLYSLKSGAHQDYRRIMANFNVWESTLSADEFYQLGYLNRYGIQLDRSYQEAYIMFCIAEELYTRPNDKRKATFAAREVLAHLSVDQLREANEKLFQRSLRHQVARYQEPYDVLLRKYGARLPPIK